MPRRRNSKEARELQRIERAINRTLQQLGEGQQPPVAPNIAEAAAAPPPPVIPEVVEAAAQQQVAPVVQAAAAALPAAEQRQVPPKRRVKQGVAVNIKQRKGAERRNLLITIENDQLGAIPKATKQARQQQRRAEEREKKQQQDLRLKLERQRLVESKKRLEKHRTLVEGVKPPQNTHQPDPQPSTSQENWSAPQEQTVPENLIEFDGDAISIEASDWSDDQDDRE